MGYVMGYADLNMQPEPTKSSGPNLMYQNQQRSPSSPRGPSQKYIESNAGQNHDIISSRFKKVFRLAVRGGSPFLGHQASLGIHHHIQWQIQDA